MSLKEHLQGLCLQLTRDLQLPAPYDVQDVGGRIMGRLAVPRAKQIATSLISDMEAIIERGVLFDFLNVEVDPALMDFGSDLASNGLMKLPFTDVIFTFRNLNFGHRLDVNAHVLCSQRSGSDPELIGREGSIDPDAIYTGVWLCMSGHDSKSPFEFGYNFDAFAQHHYVPGGKAEWQAATPEAMQLLIPGYSNKTRAPALTTALTLCEVAVALLASRGIRHDVDKAPDRVQARRAREGKPPLPERHTIIVPGTMPRASGDGTGGTHASPRPHWRRGHVRRYASGTTTVVAPCIVNGDGSAISPKQYQMAAKAA